MIKLEHANISATDVEAMTRFITTAIPSFGIRHEGFDHRGRPWRHVGNDDFYIAVSTVSEPGNRKPYSNVSGFNHLGWEVDDVEALEQRMIAAGYSANMKAHDHPAMRFDRPDAFFQSKFIHHKIGGS